MNYQRIAIIFAIVAVASAYTIAEENAKQIELSDSAKLKIRRGFVAFLNTMCTGETIEGQIMKRVCLPASKLDISLFSRCSSCDAYVDPMCMLDCPQFFDSKVDLRSRCSSCDAYVDPMCMLDCPQRAVQLMDIDV